MVIFTRLEAARWTGQPHRLHEWRSPRFM